MTVADADACPHDFLRYVLDDSAKSRAQRDGVDAEGRSYRDVPMRPEAIYAYAETIGSDFKDRVRAIQCASCGVAIEDPAARERVERARRAAASPAGCSTCGKSDCRPMEHAGWDPSRDPQR